MIAWMWRAHVSNRGLQTCILVGLLLRLGVGSVEVMGGQLPFSGQDTTEFVRTAEYWSRNGFLQAVSSYPGPSSYFISWIIAILYSIFGPEPALSILPSVLFGTLSISVAYRLSLELFRNRRIALRAAWLTALFPMMILLSASVLREAYIFYFFALAMLMLLRWTHKRSTLQLVGCFAALVVCVFFHGGMVISIIVVSVVVVIASMSEVLKVLTQRHCLSLKGAVLALCGPIFFLMLFQAEIELPKVGRLSDNIISGALADKLLTDATNAQGGAVYPSWVLPNSEVDLVIKAPLLLYYFLFGPFIWDARSAAHLIAVMDALLYIGLFWLIWINRARLRANAGASVIFWVMLTSAWIFAMSTSNFGTSIRHRAKFAVVIVALAPVTSIRAFSSPPSSHPVTCNSQSPAPPSSASTTIIARRRQRSAKKN